ncbi:hypothetical protein EBZ39_17225 [bacterium]|nr:hypothetical protein [bacterium]
MQTFAAVPADEYVIKTLLITDIYPASEAPIDGITAERLVAAIQAVNPALAVQYVPSYQGLAEHVRQVLAEGDLLLTIGAGKVNLVAEALVGSAPRKG